MAAAVWNQRVIEVRYRSWKGERTRTLRPLGIVLKGGIWYLAAGVDEQVRTYRVGRILSLVTRDETFARPPDFDLATYWQAWFEARRERMYEVRATVRLSPVAQKLLPHLFDSVTNRAAAASASEPDEHGWIEVEIPVETVEFGSTKLLQLGTEAEVLAPEEMRAYVREVLGELRGMYGKQRSELVDERRQGCWLPGWACPALPLRLEASFSCVGSHLTRIPPGGNIDVHKLSKE